MAKQKFTFEGIIGPNDFGRRLLGSGEYGFSWQNLEVIDDAYPLVTGMVPSSGVAAIRQVGSADVASFGRSDGAFSLRSFTFSDSFGNEFGQNITVRGFRDGVQVAEDYVFSFGTDQPYKFKFDGTFKNIDSVQIITNDRSFSLDDFVVRVPDPPADALF
jgi:hypothetical protein